MCRRAGYRRGAGAGLPWGQLGAQSQPQPGGAEVKMHLPQEHSLCPAGDPSLKAVAQHLERAHLLRGFSDRFRFPRQKCKIKPPPKREGSEPTRNFS